MTRSSASLSRAFVGLSVVGSLVAIASGCANVANETPVNKATATPVFTGSPGTSPTPSATPTVNPSSSPSAGSTGFCSNSTRDPNATIVVSIDPDFTDTSTTFGDIFGFAPFDPAGSGNLPTTAQVVTAKTTDLIQFANYDPQIVVHSAVGFLAATSFPAEPYAFPSGDLAAIGTTISTSAWSTGQLSSFGSSSATICYSQTFSIPNNGTYYFGDDPLYNSASSYRGVISVTP